ncbi:MAG: FGGY-family carbohydrate kinase, partial [Natronospirillum sp.]
GQVDGSVVPGQIGLEAGQSAFGDFYAWFKDVIAWPLSLAGLSAEAYAEAEARILPELGGRLRDYEPTFKSPLALDWVNGRRTPDANQRLTSALFGMNLATDTMDLFHAVVESTAFGARAINECFERQGVPIHKVIAIGGISRKSEGIMQLCADVFNKPIETRMSDQCCALGAAICGAVAADIYPSIDAAMVKLGSPTERVYEPRREQVNLYRLRYQQYLQHASYVESRVKN